MGLFENLFGKKMEFEFNGKKYTLNENSFIHYTNAMKLYPQNKFHECIEEINKAIDYFPKNPYNYFYKGYFHEDLSNYNEAIKVYNKSLEIDPNQSWVLFRLAFCYQMQKDNEMALKSYTQCISCFKEFSDPILKYSIKLEQVYNNRASIQTLLGLSEKCIEDSTKAIELNEKYPNPYLMRGIEYLKLKMNDLAESDLRVASGLGMNLAKQALDEYFPKKKLKNASNEISHTNKIAINFKFLGLEIEVPVTKIDEQTYNYPIPRPIPKGLFISQGDYTMNVSKREFIDDITFQIPKSLIEISNHEPPGELEAVAFESLYQIIVKHINQFRRILPVDLDSYIGQNILLFNAILHAQGKPTLNREQQEERFSKFNSLAYGILPDNLKVIYRTPL